VTRCHGVPNPKVTDHAATSGSPGMAGSSPAPAGEDVHTVCAYACDGTVPEGLVRSRWQRAGESIALLRSRATDARVRIRLAMELLAPCAPRPFWSGAPATMWSCIRGSAQLPASWPGGWYRGVSSRSARGQRRGNALSECGSRRTSHASRPLPC